MGPDIWNALRMQSEFLEYTSNIQECISNFHSEGIRAHSASSVTGVLYTSLTNGDNTICDNTFYGGRIIVGSSVSTYQCDLFSIC